MRRFRHLISLLLLALSVTAAAQVTEVRLGELYQPLLADIFKTIRGNGPLPEQYPLILVASTAVSIPDGCTVEKFRTDTLRFDSACDTIYVVNHQSVEVVGYDVDRSTIWSTKDSVTIAGEYDRASKGYYSRMYRHAAPEYKKEFIQALRQWGTRDITQEFTPKGLIFDGERATILRIILRNGRITDLKRTTITNPTIY